MIVDTMSGLTLTEATQRFELAMIAARTPHGTAKQYRSVVRRLSLAYPRRKYASIGATELAEFLYGNPGITLGKTPGTGQNQRSALRAFFRYGEVMRWGRAPVVPLPVLQPKAARAKEMTRLTVSQLQLMMSAVSDPIFRAMLAVAIETAFRISDIRKIRKRDLNLVTGELYVHVQKTGISDAFPVTLDLETEMRRYFLTTSWLEEGDFIFPGWRQTSRGTNQIQYEPDPSRPCSYHWATARLKEHFELCGIIVERQEAWHVIRRSVARIYFDRLRHETSHDHALRETAALLHHKNTATTERYLGLDAEVYARNAKLRGKPFILSSLPAQGAQALASSG